MSGRTQNNVTERLQAGIRHRKIHAQKRIEIVTLQKKLDEMIKEREMVLLIKDVTRELDDLIKSRDLIMTAPRLARNTRRVKREVPAFFEW